MKIKGQTLLLRVFAVMCLSIAACGTGTSPQTTLRTADGSSASPTATASASASATSAPPVSQTPPGSAAPTTEAVSGSPTASPSSSAVVDDGLCIPSALTPTSTTSGVFQGQVLNTLTVRNSGTSACGLTNQVSVSGVTSAGQHKVLTISEPPQKPDPYVLAPGAQASVTVTLPLACPGASYGQHPDSEYSSLILSTKSGKSYTWPKTTVTDFCGGLAISPWQAPVG